MNAFDTSRGETISNNSPPRRVFVLPRQRIVWLPIAKSGFTSILHMLAQVNGKQTCTSDASGYPEWSPEAAIHDPKVHRLSRIEQLGSHERKAALSAPDWWRFAVVRDPHSRFLSAWTDKVFLRAPGTPQLWHDAEDLLCAGGEIDISPTFRKFVFRFQRDTARFLRDQHFASQHSLLNRESFPNLEVIPLSEFFRVRQRLEDLGRHPPPSPRLNESLSLDPRRMYDANSHAIIAEIYKEDLIFDPTRESPVKNFGEPMVLSRLETECVHKLRSASLRIRQLSRLAVLPRLTVWLQRILKLR